MHVIERQCSVITTARLSLFLILLSIYWRCKNNKTGVTCNNCKKHVCKHHSVRQVKCNECNKDYNETEQDEEVKLHDFKINFYQVLIFKNNLIKLMITFNII